MTDVRFDRSDEAIKSALLALLEKRQLAGITMMELAKQAGVSRSTLYAHYGNVQDVYVAAVCDFIVSLKPLDVQLRCEQCSSGKGVARPFCVALRDAGEYLPLVRDGRFLSTLLDQLESGQLEDQRLENYRDSGLDEQQALALMRFQMSGCYSVALSHGDQSDWNHIQQTLDTFIRAGANAVRNG